MWIMYIFFGTYLTRRISVTSPFSKRNQHQRQEIHTSNSTNTFVDDHLFYKKQIMFWENQQHQKSTQQQKDESKKNFKKICSKKKKMGIREGKSATSKIDTTTKG